MLEKPRIGEGVLQYKWRLSMSINMEFRNVVFNAARDGKLRRLKVSNSPYHVMSNVTQQVGTDFLVNMKMFSKVV